MGKACLESTVVEGLGGTHQGLEQCVKLNPSLVALKRLFPFRFCTAGCLHAAAGAMCGCSHPMQPGKVHVASVKRS